MTTLSVLFEQISPYLPPQEALKVENIEDGYSNHVMKLHWYNAPRAVLRVPMLDTEAFLIDRHAELNALKAAQNAGISPTVIWSNDQGAILSEYIHAPALSWDVKHNSRDIKRIGALFTQVHALSVNAPSRNIYQVIEHYVGGIKHLDTNGAHKHEVAYLQHCFDQMNKVDSGGRPDVLCHNDLNPKNVLLNDEEIWFIDWEYTALGDPLFDLAAVSRSHNLTQDRQKVLIEAYDDALNVQDTLKIIYDYGFAYALREMAWLLLKHVISVDDHQSLDYYREFKDTKKLNPFI
ncbi:choline kinase family protein [Marinomonas mediterranea]|uniref:choline kinase family protein n=1 Tax=Marinomonas mediterranea TaxID=119864 RepID=UPI00234A0B52|nr:choline kinase family protein [Marinomonas mediterranea]WCN10569.1 phosphotransferase [Marinomonas mediterranea]